MFYFSTRDSSRRGRTFADVILEGLAADGGLYIPQSIPQLNAKTLEQWCGKSYVELARELLCLYAPDLEGQISCSFTQLLDDSSKNFRCAEIVFLRQLGHGNIFVGELFHGPTYAFKDVALQFLGQVLQRLLQGRGRRLALLGATSGDTGAAAIYGLRGMSQLQLTILHPHGAVSAVQRRQMCSVLDDNICNIAIKGNFDQCQTMVKQLMARSKVEANIPQLGAINSINWGRILAQITYYFALYFRLVAAGTGVQLGDTVRFVVPTGNFGNVLAGYFAKNMGLPIRLLLATNKNDILHQFISQHRQGPKMEVQPSFAPAMDIVQPSNWERYLWYLWGGDSARLENFQNFENFFADFPEDYSEDYSIGEDAEPQQFATKKLYEQLKADFSSCRADDNDIRRAISACYAAHGYVLDPHTACAYHACVQLPENFPSICLATAHPAKFSRVYRGLGLDLAVPAALQLDGVAERFHVLEENTETLLRYLRRHVWPTASKNLENGQNGKMPQMI